MGLVECGLQEIASAPGAPEPGCEREFDTDQNLNHNPLMSEDMKAEIARLKAENEALKSKSPDRGALSMKVSEKGALSIYGMGRFPVTLYKEQWMKLLNIADEIKKFIDDNCDRLKAKD